MTRPPLLRLRRDELVPAGEDREVELTIVDLLLPCRRFDIPYKVAVLGSATPTLEFLLRLVKAVPGISEEDAMAFFGYSRRELEYVLDEATGPGYVERLDGRLWLTTPGDLLFNLSSEGPAIFSVEGRRVTHGFDLLSIAPEPSRVLDRVEMVLPDLKVEDHETAGSASKTRVPESFRRFFRELGDRKDREQAKKRDLYSIGTVTAGDRFQVPVRVRVLAQASSPHIGEIDLSAWRPDHDVADRPEIERAAGGIIELLKVSANTEQASAAFQTLVEVAPEFLKEYTTRGGLSVNRYWREALSRAGDVRSDRPTVPLVGALVCQESFQRLLRVIEYGRRDSKLTPPLIISIPPQAPYWGATSILKDLLTAVRSQLLGEDGTTNEVDTPSLCVVAGKPAKYVERTFDRLVTVDTVGHAPLIEFFVVPNISVAVLVHAPIGALSGLAAPVGFASFDPAVIGRVQETVVDTTARYISDLSARTEFEAALRIARPTTVDDSGV